MKKFVEKLTFEEVAKMKPGESFERRYHGWLLHLFDEMDKPIEVEKGCPDCEAPGLVRNKAMRDNLVYLEKKDNGELVAIEDSIPIESVVDQVMRDSVTKRIEESAIKESTIEKLRREGDLKQKWLDENGYVSNESVEVRRLLIPLST